MTSNSKSEDTLREQVEKILGVSHVDEPPTQEVAEILSLIEEEIDENTSDGFHTFKELYDHRIALYIALMFAYPERSWFASHHDDGTNLDGWFIAGMHIPTGDITYHLPNVPYFNMVGANKEIEYRHFAPKWDGHSSADVVSRLNSWSANMGLSRKLANKATLNSKGER